MNSNLYQLTKELCKTYGIKPSRSKGQNFLINDNIYNQIIKAADLKPDDIVLEVGPGLGFLTAKLAAKVKKVIAVELDDRLAEVLRTGLKARGVKNVEVVNENILNLGTYNLKLETQKTTSFKLQVPSYKIIANLPYNITSVFLRKFLSAEMKPELMVLMLQKEVAERITAKAGEMSLLAVSVQFYAEPELLELVPKENFWPQPEVDSATIELKVKSEKLKVDEKKFFQLVKFGFSARRKMLKNNLAAAYRIDHKIIAEKMKIAGFSQNLRAQELSVEDWIKLFKYFQ